MGFAGVDSFEFTVTDDNQIGGGALTSQPASVQITVRTIAQAIVVADADFDAWLSLFGLSLESGETVELNGSLRLGEELFHKFSVLFLAAPCANVRLDRCVL